MESLTQKVGRKARIKIISAKLDTYWYKDKIGKTLTATLTLERVFSNRIDYQWKLWTGQRWAWVNIKDAKIIKWNKNKKS